MSRGLMLLLSLSLFASTACTSKPVAMSDDSVSLDPYAHETEQERDERMAWFRDAKFGMFIHWGVYAVPAGTYNGQKIDGIGEWIMLRGKIPVAEYKAYANDFNPVKYDPDAWVRLAKEAGMKYIVITSKHHDGFALFDSKVSEWDVVDATPYGKDLLKPLAEACRKHDMKLGFYYSQAQDWTQGGNTDRKPAWDPAQPTDMDQYLREIAAPQVKEILTNYGDIAVLWWDTNWDMNKERANLLIPHLSLQPGIIHNNRLGGGYEGDIKTPEQHIPGTGLPGDWESCMTMNRTWGFKSYDDEWKSAPTLIHNLIDIASKGGNYLLNVGPTAEGLIPQPSVDRLQAIGKWMDVNGESIYGTTASPCRIPDWGRITTKHGEDRTTLYLHVFDWQDGGELFFPVDNHVLGCRLLVDADRRFKTRRDPGRGITVQLVGDAPDAVASVIVVDITGHPSRAEIDYLRADADGVIQLPASAAVIDKPYAVRAGYRKEQDAITRWRDHHTSVSWEFFVKEPGRYAIQARVASEKGGSAKISLGEHEVMSVLPATGGMQVYQDAAFGTVEISESGVHTLTLAPIEGDWQPVSLRSVALRPEH